MIEIKDVSFTYESGESENSLRNINLKIKDGELFYCVVNLVAVKQL